MAKGQIEETREFTDYLNDSEAMDSLRAAMVLILMRETDMDMDTIYSVVFLGGDKITWH
ncbi:MAG: hypothetical protein P8Y66_05780 [Nitrospirota bacterium]